MNAEQKFNIAFAKLQRELPVIVAETPIPNRGRYARFENVMKQIQPMLAENGFSVSFTNDYKEGKITQTCHLSHIEGHTRSNSFTVRVGIKGDNDVQSDCKSATVAKRNALLNCLNIVVTQDCLTNEEDDATLEGGDEKVSEAQAFELERRCHETESNIHAFLKFAGAGSFKDIRASKYPELDMFLKRKENRGK